MGRHLLCLPCALLLAGCCVPAASSSHPFPPAPTPVIGPTPRCPFDVSSAVENTVVLLDDPRAAQGVDTCAAAVTALITEGGGSIEEAHPFWPDGRYRLTLQTGSSSESLSVTDITDLADAVPLYGEGISATQTIAIAANPDWLEATTDDQVRRAALRACVHVGQHLLRMGYLATAAGVPPECLADANQQAIVHARQVGYRPEPLAYAVVMLDAGETGAPAGPLLDVFRSLFPSERTLEGVVRSPAYGQWRASVTDLLGGQ
jgi:hypothetical protein